MQFTNYEKKFFCEKQLIKIKFVCESKELQKLYFVKSFVNYVRKFDNIGPQLWKNKQFCKGNIEMFFVENIQFWPVFKKN